MRRILILFILFFTVQYTWADCSYYLNAFSAAEYSNSAELTDLFISYLSKLKEESIIDTTALKKMYNELERNLPLSNPIEKEKSPSHSIHYDNLNPYLNSTNLNKENLRNRLQQLLKLESSTKASKTEVQNETSPVFTKMKFNRIKHGPDVSYDFEMTQTLITQKMWVDVMGENVIIEDQARDPIITLQIRDKQIRLRPEHPITNVSPLAVMKFANKLSELHGYEPVYDMHISVAAGTKASDGTLAISHPQFSTFRSTIYKKTIPSDPAKKLGYRLPTVQEWEHVLKDQGQRDSELIDSMHDNIEKYAWIKSNSDSKIHGVAELEPIRINGQPFYDLYGNISKMLEDLGKDNKTPFVAYRLFDTCDGEVSLIRLKSLNTFDYNNRGGGIGFFLVRTLTRDE